VATLRPHIAKRKENKSMRTTTIFAFALVAMPALAQPRLEVPVTITAIEAMPTPFCFFFFCGLSLGAVPDGAGGFVPFTNSRVMPDGSLRPYDPAIDGMPGVMPEGPYPALAPMPEPPTAYFDPPPPQPDYRAPPRAVRHATGKACYDGREHFVGADNGDCRHDPTPPPLPDSREWKEPE
jgi:hypothetical protein